MRRRPPGTPEPRLNGDANAAQRTYALKLPMNIAPLAAKALLTPFGKSSMPQARAGAGCWVLRSLAVALAFVGTLGAALASVLSGPHFRAGSDHAYFLIQADSWLESEAEAGALGGHLATVNEEAEQQWILDTFGALDGSRSLWIGLRREDDGVFRWVSGEPVTYENWLAGQPDNALGGEGYVHLLNAGNEYGHPAGLWNDLANSNTLFPTFNPISGVAEVAPPQLKFHLAAGELCWKTTVGARYDVLFSSTPVANWTVVESGVVGTVGEVCLPVTVAEGPNFWRLILQQ